jgi:CDP-diacylglycerol--serine O-phosphatidyltransferase
MSNAAVLLIALAAFLDGLDGRLARMLRSESAIGAELDSLVRFRQFRRGAGAGPLSLGAAGRDGNFGWIAVLIYAVCCMLRLARFNVGSRKPPIPTRRPPSPACPRRPGALLALMPVYVAQVTGLHLPARN